MLFACFSYGQTCNQQFDVEGDDSAPTVLTVNASDLTCAVGTVNSITILDAVLDDYWTWLFGGTSCGDYYSFELNIDGVVSTVCATDLIGMDITDFTTFSITSADLDNDADEVWMAVLIQVNYSPTDAPDCTTITGPVTNTEVSINGILEWEEVPGATGYMVSVGTSSGGTDVLSSFDVVDDTRYDLPGTLAGGVEYFVNVIPYNAIGEATGCTEYSFTVPVPNTGSTCADPIVVTDLPYTTTDNTSNYFDSIYEGSPGTSGCGSTSSYLNGNDVVYAYTPDSDTSVTINLSPTETYAGMFVYGSCEDIGTNCLAGAVNGNASAPLSIAEFAVTAGQTYYIVISTWPSPQTTAYTLNIVENTCVSASATYTVVSDCESGTDQFFVDVEVLDLGSATSLAINDNQSSTEVVVSVAGVTQFGPYPNGTSVIFTVENEQDSNCVLTSTSRTQTTCPPVNTTCATAIDLTNLVSPIVATTAGSTNENTLICNNSGEQVSNTAPDVYYSILVPAGSTLNIGQLENTYDSANIAFYGDCTDRTVIACFDDADETIVEWANNTGSDQTVYWIQDGYSTGSGEFTLAWSVLACARAEATFSVVSLCDDVTEGFNVEVDITSLGSATLLNVLDNNGNAQTASATGLLTFGPYDNGTNVIITVENDDDSACSVVSNSLTQLACPPENDECVNAITLTAGGVFADNEIVATNVAATRNPADHDPTSVPVTCDTSGFLTSGKDVWFNVVAPDSGSLTIETGSNGDSNMTDTALYVYRGASCSELTYEKCSADMATTNFSRVQLTGLTPGETITARVWGYNGSAGSFKISAYDASLSNKSFDFASLKVYPNPVKDVLTLSYSQNITNVSIFNLLGQQVINKALDNSEAQIDMSVLPQGAYLVKVNVQNQVKTIKVIKE